MSERPARNAGAGAERAAPKQADPAAALIRRLESRDKEAVKAARRELIALGDAAVPALGAALHDHLSRDDAVELLARIGTPAAATALMRRLERHDFKEDPKDHARLSVAHALRRLARPEPEVVEGVLRLLAREKTATALAKVLVQVLAATDSAGAVAAAVEAMAADPRFGNADFVHLLEPLREKPRHLSAVFPRAAELLDRPPRAAAVLVLANAYHAAGARPHPLADRVPALIAALDSKAADVATLAAHALGLIGDASAWPALRANSEWRVANGGRGDAWLAAESALALARNGVPEGASALRRLTAIRETADWARRQLRELGLPESAPVLTVELTPSAKARAAVAALLASPDRLGRAPDPLTPVQSGETPWPGREGPAEYVLFRYSHDGAERVALGLPVADDAGPATAGLTAPEALALYAGVALERLGEFRPLDPAAAKTPPAPAWLSEPRPLHAYAIAVGDGKPDRHYVWAGHRAGKRGIAIAGDCRPAWLTLRDGEDEPSAAWKAYRLHLGRLWLDAHAEGEEEEEADGEMADGGM